MNSVLILIVNQRQKNTHIINNDCEVGSVHHAGMCHPRSASASTMKVLLLVVLVVSLAIMASTAPAKERSLLGDILNKLIPTSGCAVPINCLVPPCPCLIG
ncbi:uncharacterized protein LOC124145709 isoform X2 [Haliotis rufescens]|uniref:uncharacterized protein LOC124145709 isoform X2 n=1 Tax=Haliotis rufescens TaxID=6454 RepID=UPI00201F0111|nr:uncharacterized protein LOC124145709 isoform X2 [Haliotis rufescens]